MAKSHTVTAAEFIQNVADQLAARRLDLEWSVSDVQRHGGPTYKTVQKIEAGHVAAPDVMEKHITALGLTLGEVYTAAFTPPGRVQPSRFSQEALDIARVFDQASPKGKQAFRALAQALDRTGPRLRFGGAVPHRAHPPSDAPHAEMPGLAASTD
jgi:hypothetical protein